MKVFYIVICYLHMVSLLAWSMKYLPLILFIAWSFNSMGQNIIPNPGFEYYVNCPLRQSQIKCTRTWDNYGKGTADYFNSCAGERETGVPINWLGRQAAYDGVGYSGIIVYLHGSTYKEYITTSFPALTKGAAYEVSMSVSLADISGTAIDDMGAFFFVTSPPDTGRTISVKPQVHYASNGFISNKQDWVRLIDTFVADSAYAHIIIGSFADKSPIRIMHLSDNEKHWAYNYSYLYIDNVEVRPLGIATKSRQHIKPPKSESKGYYLR